ncbi:unnamed protein product [Nezara viridula]|uniref:Uncharacterized protein n=1 Tax=Nezara viridula TaxID=85310 RepID=A0A9P0MNH1_NEZVI|nr:unnamed protein product [Nezara viridula]
MRRQSRLRNKVLKRYREHFCSNSGVSKNEYFYRPSEQRVDPRAVTPRHYSPALNFPRRSIRRRGLPKSFTPDLSPPDRFTPRPSWPIDSGNDPDQEGDGEEYEKPTEEFEIFEEDVGDGKRSRGSSRLNLIEEC